MKNLIYYSVGFNVNYNKILVLSIMSLRKYYFDDILIISDKNNIKELQKLFKDDKIFYLDKNASSTFNCTLNKTKVFEYNKIFEYDKICYLDCDTLVINNLDKIFESTITNKISILEEFENPISTSIMTMNEYFFSGEEKYGNILFSKKDREFIKNNTIRGLNSGVFCFSPTKYIKQLFEKISDTYEKNYTKSNVIYRTLEQPYINYYLLKQNCYVPINNLVKIAHMSIIKTVKDITDKTDNNCCVLHFVSEDVKTKFSFILNIFPRKINNYIYNNNLNI